MDIITIIEKYVELSVRSDALKKTIKDSKDFYTYAKIEGDMAFYEKDYELEKSYNNSARYHIETQGKAENDLAKVDELLAFVHNAYKEAVQSLNGIELKETAITIESKKADIERQIEALSQRRNWATSKGDVAFASHNFQEEQEYNRISSECYFEIERMKPMLYYYSLFVNDLKHSADRKNNQYLGPTGPVR